MKVEIYSDVACPWCYIGKKRFEAALEAFPGRDAVEVVMRPFQLDPTLSADPAAAESTGEHYTKKFGPQFKAMEARVAGLAAEEGVCYAADSIRVTNTFDAHRVIQLALEVGGPELQRRVAEGFFKAYFTDGRVVSDPQTLVAVAAEAGLDAERVRTMVASDEGVEAVRAAIRDAHDRGVSAVPTFVFDGRWAVSGAQDQDTFLQVLAQVEQGE